MDNFNALSKSAILTKLALDGYFIDLLTLNAFIKDWQIEAIYENEFGIEFFDNNTYLTILNKLKEKYNKAKKELKEKTITSLNKKIEPDVSAPLDVKNEVESGVENNIQTQPEKDTNSEIEIIEPQVISASAIDENTSSPVIITEEETAKIHNIQDEPEIDYSSISLEDLAKENNLCNNDINQIDSVQPIQPAQSIQELEDESCINVVDEFKNAIMPLAMRHLKPGPVSPNSNIKVVHDFIPEQQPIISSKPVQSNADNESSLDNLIIEESFTDDEIEKANKLISKAASKPLPESITETYFDTNPIIKEDIKAKTDKTQEQEQNKNTKTEDLDLVQLAQSFAQNFTGGDTKDVPPADLEQIFTESYTDTFSELQDYVKEEPEEYQSLQEDLPSDIMAPEIPKEATHFDSALSAPQSNLNAEDVRNIIREEITRQTASIIPVPKNNENVREIVREIVKQTADVVPQNAFKLDISQGTLDMIAKTIAKKIAIKLNNYYKLDSSKQNAKLKLFRQRTIELKEKNQILADENRKLKARLLETNRDLESYKPAVFGLYKYVGRKRR